MSETPAPKPTPYANDGTYTVVAPAEVKPGYMTTEFWLSTAATIFSSLVAAGVFPDTPGWARAVAVIAAIFSALGYTTARSMVKSAAIGAVFLCMLFILPGGCAQDEINRAGQSVITTTEAAKTAKDLHYAGVTTPSQEKTIADLLDASAKAEDAYYASIRAGDSAATKAAKASWAAASSALAAELAKYHLPPAATATAPKP